MPIYQGTLYTRAFAIQDKAGAAINVTGWEFRMQIRKHPHDAGAASLELTTANGGIGVASGGTDGRIFISLDEGQTLDLVTGSYKFDVLRTDQASGGGPSWLFGGKLKVKQPVTRD